MAATKYETVVLPNIKLIERWAQNGATDEQISKKLGIAYSTFREYVKKIPALSAALKKSKKVVDTDVENALLKRALGYKYDEVTQERITTKDVEGNQSSVLVTTKIVTKQVVPDVAAQFIWLKNRLPDKWRDKPEVGGHNDTSLMEALLAAVSGKAGGAK
jgi:predicted transport protein